jgi:hypothetical protein
MATHIHDSYVGVRAQGRTEFLGAEAARVELREIEGEPVVTPLGADESVKT